MCKSSRRWLTVVVLTENGLVVFDPGLGAVDVVAHVLVAAEEQGPLVRALRPGHVPALPLPVPANKEERRRQ